MRIRIRYFAKLRETTGREDEWRETGCATIAELWRELALQYGFETDPRSFLVALDDEFCAWNQALHEGATVVFIPPVAGG